MPCVRCRSTLTYLNSDGERECSWCGHVQYNSEPLDYKDRTHKYESDVVCEAVAMRRDGMSWGAIARHTDLAESSIAQMAQRHLDVCEKCGGVSVS